MTDSSRLLLGTKNKGKFLEMQEILEPLSFTLVSPLDLGITQDAPEEAETFEENAIGKARFYRHLSALPTLADDSGLFVDALANELGVKTRRWGAGAEATDQEWLDHFLKRMKTEDNRKARFVTVLAYIDDAEQEYLFTGVCNGSITQTQEMTTYPAGLPLLSCFKPDGYDNVLGLLSREEKDHINHRRIALQQFVRSVTN